MNPTFLKTLFLWAVCDSAVREVERGWYNNPYIFKEMCNTSGRNSFAKSPHDTLKPLAGKKKIIINQHRGKMVSCLAVQ